MTEIDRDTGHHLDTLARVWTAFRAAAPIAEIERTAVDASVPLPAFYLAALAYARGADGDAARLAALAARAAPADGLYRAAATYLDRIAGAGRDGVYRAPAGFRAFIRGGGNVALYHALTAALRERYRDARPATLLDIGAGDGRALLPALTADVGHVDVLEPAESMLAALGDALRERGIGHAAARGGVADLVAGDCPWPADRRWELTQATFALHTIARPERVEALRWIRRHTGRLLIAEFDVPRHEAYEPEWFVHVVSRYRKGLAEYADGDAGGAGPAARAGGAARARHRGDPDTGDLVAQGFLMPVMFGYFDPGNPHHEQPLAAWRDDLRTAGFGAVQATRLYDYWWAPAYLLDATAAGEDGDGGGDGGDGGGSHRGHGGH